MLERVHTFVGSGDLRRGFVGLLRILHDRYDVVVLWAAALWLLS
jgi:hypothetical protein